MTRKRRKRLYQVWNGKTVPIESWDFRFELKHRRNLEVYIKSGGRPGEQHEFMYIHTKGEEGLSIGRHKLKAMVLEWLEETRALHEDAKHEQDWDAFFERSSQKIVEGFWYLVSQYDKRP